MAAVELRDPGTAFSPLELELDAGIHRMGDQNGSVDGDRLDRWLDNIESLIDPTFVPGAEIDTGTLDRLSTGTTPTIDNDPWALPPLL
jgi:hypothetical protein